MRILARQFVMGRTIEEALARARPAERKGYRHSYDMLGEAARTAADAARYLARYREAIGGDRRERHGARSRRWRPASRSSCRRCIRATRKASARACCAELPPRLLALAEAAKERGIGLTIDAEEADRLDLSLDLVAASGGGAVARGLERARPRGAGLSEARAAADRLARRSGAAQQAAADGAAGQGRLLGQRDQAQPGARARGLSGLYAQARDRRVLSRLRKRLLGRRAAFFPQFATHNAHTVAAVLALAGKRAISSSSACTAWARRSTTRSSRPACRAASMRRSAGTRICWPIWCGACWRTAPTPPSSIAWSTTRRRSRRSSPIRSSGSPRSRRSRIRASRCRAIFTAPSAAIRAASISPTRTRWRELQRRRSTAAEAAWRAAPIVAGKERTGPARAARDPADRRRIVGTGGRGRRSGGAATRSPPPRPPRRAGRARRPRSAPPRSTAPPICMEARTAGLHGAARARGRAHPARRAVGGARGGRSLPL